MIAVTELASVVHENSIGLVLAEKLRMSDRIFTKSYIYYSLICRFISISPHVFMKAIKTEEYLHIYLILRLGTGSMLLISYTAINGTVEYVGFLRRDGATLNDITQSIAVQYVSNCPQAIRCIWLSICGFFFQKYLTQPSRGC